MSHHSYEPSDQSIGVRFWKISNGLHMLLTRLHPILHDMMCEINNFMSEQATFGGLKFQMLHLKPVKDNPHVV